MALNKKKLKEDIEALMDSMVGYDDQEGKSQADAIRKFAQDLSTAIDTFVKTGEVKTTVTGTCPQGAVTGTGKGGIS